MSNTVDTMLAAVYERYGAPEVVQLKQVARPVPKDNEVCIRIQATTVNSGDVRLRKADPFLVRLFFGFFKPKSPVLGVDVAGVVESVGKKVTLFKPGDEVFGSAYDAGLGAHAEYKCLPEDTVLSTKPHNLDFGESASLFFGAHTSLHFLRKGQVTEGSKVLIYGASGALGVHAVQLARHFGAEVHGVCSGRNVLLVKSLGADHVFDYTREDFSKSGNKYDIIYDTVGKSPFRASVRSLVRNGRYCRAVHMSPGPMLLGMWTQITTSKKIIAGEAPERVEDLHFIKELVEGGIIRPVIDRRYPLEAIAEAHRYVELGHKTGSVVITVR